MKAASMITLILGLFVTQAGAGLIPSEEIDAAHCGLKAARLIENSATGAVIFPDAPGSCQNDDDELSEESTTDALRQNPAPGLTDQESTLEIATVSSSVNP